MRKLYLSLSILVGCLFFMNGNLLAQTCTNTASGTRCARSNFFHGEILPNNGCASYTTVTSYSPGEYFRVPVLQGACYTVSTCGSGIDTQLGAFQGTLTTSTSSFSYNDDNGPACTGTRASIVMVPNFSDYARVDVRQYNCQAGGTQSITVNIRQNNNLNITSSSGNMCQGQTRLLTATPARVTGTVLTGSGDVGTFSGTGVSGTTFTAPTPAGATGAYTVTYTFGYCNATQTINVYKNPSTANAGVNQTICSTSATLAATNPSVGSGTWTVQSGPGTVTNPGSPTSTVTGLAYGQTTTLRWTVSHGPCNDSFDDVVITVQNLPTTSNAGPDQNVCASSTTLAANAPSTGTGAWTLVGGTGTITAPTNPTTTVTGLGAGSNTFRWTISNGSCTPSTDDVVITRDQDPTTAIAGADQVLCDSSTTLAGNSPSVGTGMWSVISGTATISTPGSPSSAVTNIAVGNAELVWEISNGACIASRDTMMITRNAAPVSPTVTGAMGVCPGGSTSLIASSGATNPSYEWFDAATGGTTVSSTAIYSTPTLTSPDTFWVQVTDASTSCISERTMVAIGIYATPTPSLGPDQSACASDTVCLSAGANYTSYMWSNAGTDSVECFVGGGMISVEVTDSNTCVGSDTVMITAIPNPVVNLGADTTICQGTSIMIGVAADSNSTYLWNNGDTTSMITVNDSGMYMLTCTDTNGCSGMDDVHIGKAALPVAGFTADTNGCPVIVFTDGSSDATSWSWNFGDGNTSSSQNPANNYTNAGNGNYTVTLVATGPCGVDSTTQTVSINCLVAVIPGLDNAEIAIYPNPNSGSFRIQVDGIQNNDFALMIYNAVGQEVYQWNTNEHNGSLVHDVTLDHQPAGVYYAKFVVGEQKMTQRIIIQR